MSESVEKVVARAITAKAAELSHDTPKACTPFQFVANRADLFAQAALSAIPAAHQYGHLMTEGYFSDRAKQQIYSPAIPAQGDVVAWMYHMPGDLKYGWQQFEFERRIQVYEGMSCNEEDAGMTETPLVRQSALTAAHARIAELEAREAEADKFAEVLAVIAYESPEEPWKVAYDALKSSARVIRGESSR